MKTIGKSNTSGQDLPPPLITVNLQDLSSGIDPITGVQTSVSEILGDFSGLHPSFSESKKGSSDDINVNSLFMGSYIKSVKEKGQTPITILLDTNRQNLHPNTIVTRIIEAETTN